MGKIYIETTGSFQHSRSRTFSAQDYGHASAVAQAIEWLSSIILPEAIRQDHKLHEDNCRPDKEFGRDVKV